MSLAFLFKFAAAAAAGFAAVAPVPGAAGLAGLAAVLQRGAGVGPLQPVVLQQQRLKHRQVLLPASDLSPHQHGVGLVPRFLEVTEEDEMRDPQDRISDFIPLISSSPQTLDTRPAGGTPPTRAL